MQRWWINLGCCPWILAQGTTNYRNAEIWKNSTSDQQFF